MGIEKATFEEATRPPQNGFLARIGGPQFLVAQLFTIAATILGVYLAGYVGFQRTLEYDRYQKAQQQSSLLEAMQAELKDNTSRIREFVDKRMDPSGAKRTYGWPGLRLFVWRAAGQTQSAFDLPPKLLAGMQSFYDEAGELLTSPKVREVYGNSSGSYVYDRTTYKEQLITQLEIAETKLLPDIAKAVAEASRQVNKYASVGN